MVYLVNHCVAVMEAMSAADYSDMQQELKRRTKQYRVMKERNQEMADEMQSLKSSLEALRQSPTEFAAPAPVQQTRRSEVKFDALKLQIGDLNRRRKVLQHEIDTLTGALTKEKDRADSLQSRVTELEQELQGQQGASVVKKKALKIQKENKELRETVNRLERQITQMEAGEASTGSGQQDFASERAELLQQVADHQETISKRKVEIDLLKEARDNAYRQVEKLAKETKANKDAGATETMEEVAALRAGVKQYKKQVKTLITEKSAADVRIQDLECQVLERSGTDLETRCNEQHAVIQELHREIQRNREELSSLREKSVGRTDTEDRPLEIRHDESHVSYLTENIAALELQMAQMLNGLESIETNASAIVVDSEKIASYSGLDARAKHNASSITKASNKILKILETMS